MINMYSHNNVSFQAKVGKNALKTVKDECHSDKQVAKFKQLFEDTFVKNIDENTIVDLDKNNNYIFSHTAFPKIKYKSKQKPIFKKSFSNSLLQECPKTLTYLEIRMFRSIISKCVKSGRTFDELENFAQEILKNEKSREHFLENLNLATRIKNEYPKSQLKNFEFDYMMNKVLEEHANTFGTDLYNLIHNFNSK